MEPNLREYTLLEAADLAYKWLDLEEQGNFEEAGSRIRSDKKKKKVTMEELKD